MVAMLRCTHWCCKTCAITYFELQVRDQSILATTCPFCKEPSDLAENADTAAEYFNNLDILLKNLLEPKFHEMFHRKLRDWALLKMPNFKWCSKVRINSLMKLVSYVAYLYHNVCFYSARLDSLRSHYRLD